jgi:hypothetical protein
VKVLKYRESMMEKRLRSYFISALGAGVLFCALFSGCGQSAEEENAGVQAEVRKAREASNGVSSGPKSSSGTKAVAPVKGGNTAAPVKGGNTAAGK